MFAGPAAPLQFADYANENVTGSLKIALASYAALRGGAAPESLNEPVVQSARPTERITFKGNVWDDAYTDVWIVASNGKLCGVTLEFWPGVYRMSEAGPGIWDIRIYPSALGDRLGTLPLPTTEYATFYAWDGGSVLKPSEAPMRDIPAARPDPRLVFDANADGEFETIYVDVDAITNTEPVDNIVADRQDGHLAGSLMETAVVDGRLFGLFDNGSLLLLEPNAPQPPAADPLPMVPVTPPSQGGAHAVRSDDAESVIPIAIEANAPARLTGDLHNVAASFWAERHEIWETEITELR